MRPPIRQTGTLRLRRPGAAVLAAGFLIVAAATCGRESPPADRGASSATVNPDHIYVTDETRGNVVIVDPAAGTVVASIPVGKRPRGAHLSADGTELLVALSGSPIQPPGVDESTLPPADRAADGIGVVDLAGRKLSRVLPSGQDPETFDISPDGTVAYLSNEETAEMSALNLATGTITGVARVGEEPEGVTVRPGGAEVYVTSEGDSAVYVVNATSLEVMAKIPTAARPRSVAFTTDGATAFVTDENAAAVTVIDANTHQNVATIAIPSVAASEPGAAPLLPRPMGIVLSRDGSQMYVSLGRGQAVAVIDVATRAVVKQVTNVGTRPWGLAVSRDGRKIYTANGPSGDVSIIDIASGTVERKIQVGGSPWGVTVGH
jgi:YVTN family beta-propeller protein